MKFMMMIFEDEAVYADAESPTVASIYARHDALVKSLGSAFVSGEGLANTPTAKTVRTTGVSVSVHDGPFAETKEQLGGYYLVDVADMDAAIDIAKRIPLSGNGSVEVRPVVG